MDAEDEVAVGRRRWVDKRRAVADLVPTRQQQCVAAFASVADEFEGPKRRHGDGHRHERLGLAPHHVLTGGGVVQHLATVGVAGDVVIAHADADALGEGHPRR